MPPLPHYLEIMRRNYSGTMYTVAQGLEWLKRYHRYRVVGIENVPDAGPALLVTNHSFATYDGMLLATEIFRLRGRMQWALADRAFFRFRHLRQIVTKLNFVEASPEAARQLLREGKIFWVLPGGMREALRSSREKYQVRWQDRTGFARLSLETRAPIVLSACPASDEIYTLYPNPLTDAVYRRLRLPFALVRGWGPTLLPRPVPLAHYIDEPIYPPVIAAVKATDEEIRAYHAMVIKRMEQLMAKALEAERARGLNLSGAIAEGAGEKSESVPSESATPLHD